MRAAVIKAPNTDLQIEDHDCPSPSSGEVLIRVHACGVCHGDLMLQHGQFPFAHYPIVAGHEIAGVVEDVGQGVSNLQHGDRVGLSALFSSCGRCQQCLKDDEFLCPKMQFTGITHDGGYQQFMLARADYVARLPDQLSFVEAAPLMCAGLTVFSGLRHAGFQPQNKVAVIGLGGLGHIGVLFVRAMGGRVAVLSTSANKRYEALDLGAELFINIESESASEALRAWDGGADIILATSPAAEPMGAAFPGLALNGTMMVLGAPPNDIAVSPMELIMGRRRLMGSPAGSRKDLRDTLDLAATHSVCARVTPMPLEHAGKALKQMDNGSVHGRLVLTME